MAEAALDRLMRLGGELYTPPGEPRRKFDLAHMRALLARLNNPEQRFPSILIAGTNGKGSTAATLASILSAAGYTTGLYTSPHLQRVNERIRILSPGAATQLPQIPDAPEISDATLFTCLAEVEQAAAALITEGALPGPPSFFETMTAIAMLTFAGGEASTPVNIAVLEVGIGGRLDATNVVEPILSIITDIALDHTEWLGPTLTHIAREKAGILREHGVMVTLPQHPEANQALGEVAVALHVTGVNAAEYLPGRDTPDTLANHYTVAVDGELIEVRSPLRGHHQRRNIALAIAAISVLRNSGMYKSSPSNSDGYNISRPQIEQGIRETAWPGRLETISRSGAPTILLDVAHNPAGAWALRAAVNQFTLPARTLIFGCMRDKALVEMAQILFPIFDHIYLTELPSPRAASLEELAAAAENTGASYSVHPNPASALDAALAKSSAPAQDSLVVAGGSVLLIGDLRTLLL